MFERFTSRQLFLTLAAAVACLTLAVALFVVMRPRERAAALAPRAVSTPVVPAAQMPRHEPPPTPEATPAIPTPEPAPWTSDVTLTIPLGASHHPPTQALVGPLLVDEADVMEWLAWLEEGAVGAGPARLADLGNVKEWMQVPPPVPLEDGSWQIGPLAAPRGIGYQVMAWNPQHTLWLGDERFDDEPEPGAHLTLRRIEPQAPTQLRLVLQNVPRTDAGYLLYLGRVPSEDSMHHEAASRMMRFIEKIEPDLGFAYSADTPMLLEAAAPVHVLSPLPPDAGIELVFSRLTGVQAAPVIVELVPHEVREVVVDMAMLFPHEAAPGFTLRGQVLVGNSAVPLPGASIRELGRMERTATTDASGAFTLDYLPFGPEVRFEVSVEETPEGQRPLTVRRHEFSFEPDDAQRAQGPPAGPLEVIWRMPAHSWLVATIPQELRAEMAAEAEIPYPIYALQRRDPEVGMWRDTRSEAFVDDPAGVAVGIARLGDFRVVVAGSPLWCVYSEGASFETPADGIERRVNLDASAGSLRAPELTLVCIDDATGAPAADVALSVYGPHRSLPPLVGAPNRAGRFSLGPVTVPRLIIGARYGRQEEREIEVDVTREVKPGGIIELRL